MCGSRNRVVTNKDLIQARVPDGSRERLAVPASSVDLRQLCRATHPWLQLNSLDPVGKGRNEPPEIFGDMLLGDPASWNCASIASDERLAEKRDALSDTKGMVADQAVPTVATGSFAGIEPVMDVQIIRGLPAKLVCAGNTMVVWVSHDQRLALV